MLHFPSTDQSRTEQDLPEKSLELSEGVAMADTELTANHCGMLFLCNLNCWILVKTLAHLDHTDDSYNGLFRTIASDFKPLKCLWPISYIWF